MRADAEGITLAQEEVAEFGAADSNCVRQHGLENRRKHTRRAADDLQHLRNCGLLLQRLGKVRSRVDELPLACFELLLQLAVVFVAPTGARSHLRSGRTKLGTVHSALRPFASQDHLAASGVSGCGDFPAEKIAHLGAAGDCCTAGFQPGL